MHGADHTVLIAFLAVGGAILAAIIAAVSADTRQRRQLSHDRQLQDLAELRSVMDEATVAFVEAIHALHEAFSGVINLPDADERRADEEESEEKADEFDKAVNTRAQAILKGWSHQVYNDDMTKCAETRDRMIVIGQRMAIRLGDDRAINATYQTAIRLVIDTPRHIGVQRHRRKAGAQLTSKDFAERNDQLRAARTDFLAQAVEFVGSRLPEQRKPGA